jgi:hypothetical protein
VTGRALITCLALAGVGCSLQKTGTGDDLSLGGDTAIDDTTVDDTTTPIDTSVEDSSQEDSVAVDTTLPPDEGTDTTVAETSADTAVDVPVEADAPATLSIVCSELAAGTDVNLTSEGTIGWAHWGLVDAKSYDHKSASTVISDVTVAGGSAIQYGAFETSASWSDGTPTVSSSATKSGIYVTTNGATFTLSVTGDGAIRALRVYLRTYAGAQASLKATVGSATATSALAASPSTKTYACETTFATSASLQFVATKTSGASVALLSATIH